MRPNRSVRDERERRAERGEVLGKNATNRVKRANKAKKLAFFISFYARSLWTSQRRSNVRVRVRRFAPLALALADSRWPLLIGIYLPSAAAGSSCS